MILLSDNELELSSKINAIYRMSSNILFLDFKELDLDIFSCETTHISFLCPSKSLIF